MQFIINAKLAAGNKSLIRWHKKLAIESGFLFQDDFLGNHF